MRLKKNANRISASSLVSRDHRITTSCPLERTAFFEETGGVDLAIDFLAFHKMAEGEMLQGILDLHTKTFGSSDDLAITLEKPLDE
jgi:hypothetical protein